MQGIRRHLTFANVVSLIALFVALGGTGFAASYVVSSNSQVGPGTISGHKPPNGDHANLIPGSLNSTDLATGAVTAPDLANGSVGTSKFTRTATAPDATHATNSDKLGGKTPSAFFPATKVRRISYEKVGTTEQVLSLSGLTLRGSCTTNASSGHITVTASDTTTSDLEVSYISSGNAPHEQDFVIGSSPAPVLDVSSAFDHGSGTMIVYTEDAPTTPVVAISFAYEAGAGTPCEFHGIATTD